MRATLRSFFVFLFAAAVVFNGWASVVLAKVPAAHSNHVVAMGGHAGHQGQNEAQYFAQPSNATGLFDHLPAHDHANGSSKCCTMCVAFDNLTPAFVATVSQFHYRAIFFKIGRQDLAGHLVALDPDIPKTIV